MLVLMLAGDGVLHLDDKITKYLGSPNPAWHDITIRILLTHTSGISNDALDDGNLSLTYTNDQVLKMIAKTPLDFTPGTKWKYSNCGYELLGFVIQKATGTFYGDLLARRVWTPLGMTSTRIIDLADIVPYLAPGYVWASASCNTSPTSARVGIRPPTAACTRPSRIWSNGSRRSTHNASLAPQLIAKCIRRSASRTARRGRTASAGA